MNIKQVCAILKATWSAIVAGPIALGAAGALSACGAEAPEDQVAFGNVGQALQFSWRSDWASLPATPNGFKYNPAACAAQHSGYELVTTDNSTSRYRMWVYESAIQFSPNWTQLDTETFSSKPTCAGLRGLDASSHTGPGDQVVVLGRKSSNSRYAASVWNIQPPPPIGGSVGTPTRALGWTEINSATYASAPSAAVSNGELVVVGRRSNHTLWLHRQLLTNGITYNNANWQAPVQIPALPGSWQAKWTPAVAPLLPSAGIFAIVVRAENSSGQFGLWYYPWANWAPGNWTQIPVGAEGVASGEPAVEYTYEWSDFGEVSSTTVYYRANNNGIYFISGDGTFNSTPQRINTATFTGGPAAVGNMQLESHHVVISPKTDGIFYFIGGNFFP